jgi:hypothetical protein
MTLISDKYETMRDLPLFYLPNGNAAPGELNRETRPTKRIGGRSGKTRSKYHAERVIDSVSSTLQRFNIRRQIAALVNELKSRTRLYVMLAEARRGTV